MSARVQSATDQFEDLFQSVDIDQNMPFTVVLCSGALGLPDHPPPVLCATEDLAIELWSRTARDYLLEQCGALEAAATRWRLVWARKPSVMKFKMTIQDDGGHRVASARYAVYSLCAIVEMPQDVAPETCLKPSETAPFTTTEPEPPKGSPGQ